MTADMYKVDQLTLDKLAKELGIQCSEAIRYAHMELGMMHDEFNRRRGSSLVELRHVPITREQANAILKRAVAKAERLRGGPQQTMFD